MKRLILIVGVLGVLWLWSATILQPALSLRRPAGTSPVEAAPLLLLHSTTGTAGNYRTVTGEVRNRSSREFRRVQVFAAWRDAAGQILASGSSLLDVPTLGAGQTSTFRVMVRDVPASAQPTLTFKSMLEDGSIAHARR
jgi:hypothetical protein